MRNAEKEKSEADQRAEADVEGGECQEVATDAVGCLTDGLRRDGQVGAPGQTDGDT